MDGSKRRKLGSRVNEKTGSGIGIDTRFITFFFLMDGLQMFPFLLKIFHKKKKKKDPFTMISHIKNISMGLWLHKERKHTYNIQICTSCMWAEISKFIIYTKTFFFVLVILTQRWAQCNSRSSDVSTGRVVQSTWSYTVPLLYVFNDAPLEYVSMQTVWCCYKNVSFNVHFVLAVYTVRLQTLLF